MPRKLTHKERIELLRNASGKELERLIKHRLEGETEPLGEPDRNSREAYIDILLEAYSTEDLNFKNRFRGAAQRLLEKAYLSHAATDDKWYVWRLVRLAAHLLSETVEAS